MYIVRNHRHELFDLARSKKLNIIEDKKYITFEIVADCLIIFTRRRGMAKNNKNI